MRPRAAGKPAPFQRHAIDLGNPDVKRVWKDSFPAYLLEAGDTVVDHGVVSDVRVFKSNVQVHFISGEVYVAANREAFKAFVKSDG